MSAKGASSGESSPGVDPFFAELETSINERFRDAIVFNGTDERWTYFRVGGRADASHRLGLFCLASSIEPFTAQPAEQLRLSVPILRSDIRMPQSVLGTDTYSHYFYLTYRNSLQVAQTVRLDPDVYARDFLGSSQPPVVDLAAKIVDEEQYIIIPMGIQEPDELD